MALTTLNQRSSLTPPTHPPCAAAALLRFRPPLLCVHLLRSTRSAPAAGMAAVIDLTLASSSEDASDEPDSTACEALAAAPAPAADAAGEEDADARARLRELVLSVLEGDTRLLVREPAAALAHCKRSRQLRWHTASAAGSSASHRRRCRCLLLAAACLLLQDRRAMLPTSPFAVCVWRWKACWAGS